MQEKDEQPKNKNWLSWVLFFLPVIVVTGELLTVIFFLVKGAESLSSSESFVTFLVLVVVLIVAAITIVVMFYNNKRKKIEIEQKNSNLSKELEINKQKLKIAEGYKKSFKLISDGFRKVHKITAEGPHDFESYNTAMSIFCTNLARVFHDITGKKYSVCIKLLADDFRKVDYKQLSVVTFCRDIHSDDRNEGDNMEHLVVESTAFDTILKNINRSKGRYFCKNRLPYVMGYYNSSFKKYDGFNSASPYPHHMSGDEKDRHWPLPYKSCLIVPICPGDDKERAPQHVYGFLCIDSPEMDSFEEETDAILMIGCGDGLYHDTKKIIGLINDQKQKQSNGEQAGKPTQSS